MGTSSASVPKLTVDQFLDALEKSGLLTAQALHQARSEVSSSQGDSRLLAKRLVDSKLLTPYQATALYHGRSDELVIGCYKILGRLGAGGMGTVFKAVKTDSGLLVALKLIAGSANSPENILRFEREARAAAALVHPNIVKAVDYGEIKGRQYFAMEYIEGTDLAALSRKQGRLPIAVAVAYVVQAARGLAYAHSLGVIHRDVKPGNLVVDHAGRVKVLDLGLARFDDPSTAAKDLADKGLTQSGQVLGTVDYMAPEQALNLRRADARADVYGLGCTLYRLLSGRRMYGGETVIEKIIAHRERPIPSLRAARADVPEPLDNVFRRSVAKEPDDRYQTMGQFADELEQSLLPSPATQTAAVLPPPAQAQPNETPAVPSRPPVMPTPIAVPRLSPHPLSGNTQAPTQSPTTTRAIAALEVRRRKRQLQSLLILALLGVVGIVGGSAMYRELMSPRRIAGKSSGAVRAPAEQTVGVPTASQDTLPSKQLPAPSSHLVEQPQPIANESSKPSSVVSTPIVGEAPAATQPVVSPSEPRTAPTILPPPPPSTTTAPQPPATNVVATVTPTDKPNDRRLAAIDAGLKWLVGVQQPEGNWTCKTGPDAGNLKSPTGATGLAALALLRAGITPLRGDYGKELDDGLRFLIAWQNRFNGSLIDDGNMYSQALGALALCEAYQRTEDLRFKLPSQRTIGFIVAAQDPKGGGWRYKPREPGDTSVTGWQIQALEAGKALKVNIPERTFLGARAFLEQVQRDGGRRYRYQSSSDESHSMSAAGLFSSLQLGTPLDDPAILEGSQRLLDVGVVSDAYQNYYVTRLMRALGGEYWKRWDDRITSRLLDSQETARSLRGSWEPDLKSQVGKSGGRLIQTAMNLLILESAIE